MSTLIRMLGKSNAETGEPLYLMEIQLNRIIVIGRADIHTLVNSLHEGNSDGSWDEPLKLIASGFADDISPADIPGTITPWKSINVTNKDLSGLVYALSTQDDEVSFSATGSVDAGGITFCTTICGRPYTKTVKSSKEAKIYAESLQEFHDSAVAAGISPKTIQKLASAIDWALRAAGIYELAEKAWEVMKEKLEAERQQRAFEKELHEMLDREHNSGIDRAHEIDFGDKMSRTA